MARPRVGPGQLGTNNREFRAVMKLWVSRLIRAALLILITRGGALRQTLSTEIDKALRYTRLSADEAPGRRLPS
jgi:hypothetical protein